MSVKLETNRELQQRIEDEMSWDPSVPPGSIGVAVSDGAATLTGTVHSLSGRLAAVRAAKRVKGVRTIADDIVVQPVGLPARSDHDIAITIEHLLDWNTQVPENVRATVRDGVVALEGEVDWQYQRRAAERAVQHLSSVQHVVNNIMLKKAVSTRDIHHRITSALHRRADIDAHAITVDADGGEVWLKGTVSSWAERERAEAAAWAAPGVTTVHDDIRIG